MRRDSLHAIINSLPDPNYATLRAMTLHLYRVMDNSHVNRMNSHNLAVIFGPTLMGSDPSVAISDAGWQIKVVDTILQNTYRIFDEDWTGSKERGLTSRRAWKWQSSKDHWTTQCSLRCHPRFVFVFIFFPILFLFCLASLCMSWLSMTSRMRRVSFIIALAFCLLPRLMSSVFV